MLPVTFNLSYEDKARLDKYVKDMGERVEYEYTACNCSYMVKRKVVLDE